MTIPGRGDLSPRRRRRSRRSRLAVVVIALVVLGGGYAGYHFISGGSSQPKVALPACAVTTPTAPPVQAARVIVRNGTLKAGLATHVARALRKRDFTVGKVGNTLFRGKGVATVQYSADRLQAAQLLAAQFTGATLMQVDGTKTLEVDIGPKYRALATPAEAQAAEQALATPTPTPTPSATASPTCAT